MILLDRLSKLSPRPATGGNQVQAMGGVLPSYTDQINKPPVSSVAPAQISQRMSQSPARGVIGSMPQWQGEKRRFIADLPANVQIKGIQSILNGQETQNTVINNFVKGMASQGKSPEEIREAFMQHQKSSSNPLVLM